MLLSRLLSFLILSFSSSSACRLSEFHCSADRLQTQHRYKLWNSTKPEACETGTIQRKIAAKRFNGNVLFIFYNFILFIYTYTQTHLLVSWGAWSSPAKGKRSLVRIVIAFSHSISLIRIQIFVWSFEFVPSLISLCVSLSNANRFLTLSLRLDRTTFGSMGSICAQTIYFLTEYFNYVFIFFSSSFSRHCCNCDVCVCVCLRSMCALARFSHIELVPIFSKWLLLTVQIEYAVTSPFSFWISMSVGGFLHRRSLL